MKQQIFVVASANRRIKIGVLIFWLVFFMSWSHTVHAAMWDNLNQFEPNKIASEDVVNMMFVCINDTSKIKVYENSQEKRFHYCVCMAESIRSSASIDDFKSSDVAQRCFAEANSEQVEKIPSDQFMSVSKLYNYALACSERMKTERLYSSLGYRSIACGCILDWIQKERNMSPSKEVKKFCHEYASKEHPDNAEQVRNRNRIIVLLVFIGLPIIILVDSKIRLGKFSWGWALTAFVGMVGIMALLVNEFKASPDLGKKEISAVMIGALIGAYAGGFALYRVMSRKNVKSGPG